MTITNIYKDVNYAWKNKHYSCGTTPKMGAFPTRYCTRCFNGDF